MMNEVIEFSEKFDSHGVGIVDIEKSSMITATLNRSKTCQYYEIFLNSMASIITSHGGDVVKNIGDSLLYHFPKTSDTIDNQAFIDLLECGMAMISAHPVVNSMTREKGLPCLNYRISSDHGPIFTAKCATSLKEDIFGPTVNLCEKINHGAKSNSMVIGGDLYQIVKSFEGYRFESIFGYSNGLKLQYPVYSISRHK
jgi:class 3 adenylate cyclase